MCPNSNIEQHNCSSIVPCVCWIVQQTQLVISSCRRVHIIRPNQIAWALGTDITNTTDYKYGYERECFGEKVKSTIPWEIFLVIEIVILLGPLISAF